MNIAACRISYNRRVMTAHCGRVATLTAALTAIVSLATGPSLSAQPVQVPSASLASDRLMPVLGQQTTPAYPPDAAAGGTVDVEIVVDVDGSIAHARVAASSDGSGVLDRASLAAITRWRLTPAASPDGRRYATLALARFTFAAPQPPRGEGAVSVQLVAPPPLLPPAWEATQSMALRDAKEVRFAPPRLIRNIRPSYTEDAMRARIQGTVTLEVVVLADGTVGAGRVANSLHEGLDRAALVAARYWYFEPARIAGQAVATKAVVELSFSVR